MATAGDLLFQGGADQGVLRAFDARTGDIVWTFRTGTGFQSSAISYLGPDGRQYLAIVASSRASDPHVALDVAPDAASPVSAARARCSTSSRFGSRARRMRRSESPPACPAG